MPKIKWEFLEEALGTWRSKYIHFWEQGGFDRIFEQLKARSERGEKIAPESGDVFRCFRLTPLHKLKVVMMGMCPYHSVRNGEIVADGLLMSCSKTEILQPSLDKFYCAL